MAINDELKKLQSATMLIQAASLASKTVDKSERVPASRNSNSVATVHQGVRVAFFFDGTGNNGLRDPESIAFFDTYVHDSLAGFAKDATLPSDPRVIYTGGDNKLPYAINQPPVRGIPISALG
jgi:hypothetical protein